MLMRFEDNPEPAPGPVPNGSADKVMHANMRIGTTDDQAVLAAAAIVAQAIHAGE